VEGTLSEDEVLSARLWYARSAPLGGAVLRAECLGQNEGVLSGWSLIVYYFVCISPGERHDAVPENAALAREIWEAYGSPLRLCRLTSSSSFPFEREPRKARPQSGQITARMRGVPCRKELTKRRKALRKRDPSLLPTSPRPNLPKELLCPVEVGLIMRYPKMSSLRAENSYRTEG